jgi:hypothetical protein
VILWIIPTTGQRGGYAPAIQAAAMADRLAIFAVAISFSSTVTFSILPVKTNGSL